MSAPVQHSRHGGMPRRKGGVPQPLSTTAYGTKRNCRGARIFPELGVDRLQH
jgi:hypothetical protein